jgi:prevent-host-death family protein
VYRSYHGRMPVNASAEVGIRELRAGLSDVINATAVRGRTTYITSRGRRVAAVVPVPQAEELEKADYNRHALSSLKAALDGLPVGERSAFLIRWYEEITGDKLGS